MAWSDTGRKATAGAFGVSSLNLTLNSTVSGDFIGAASSIWGSGSAPTACAVSDNVNGAYTASAFRQNGVQGAGLNYLAAGAGGNLTLTFTPSGGLNAFWDFSVYAHEFAGGHATPASGSPVTNAGSGSAASTNGVTPADSSPLVLAVLGVDGSGTITENAGSEGFTLSNELQGGTGQPGSFVFKIISGSPGTPSHSWTNPSADWATVIAAFRPAATAGENQDADTSAAAGMGATFAAQTAAAGALTAGVTGGAAQVGQSAAVASVTAGVSAASGYSAQAAALAALTAGVGAAEAPSGSLGALRLISAGANASAVLSAVSAAVAAMQAGLAAGETWASHAATAAALAAAGNFGATFEAEAGAALAAETNAGATFAAACDSIGLLVAGSTLADAISAVAASIGVLISGASLSATFTALGGDSDSFSASASLEHVFAALSAAVGAVQAGISADALLSARAVTLAALQAGATLGAAFIAEGGLPSILPPAKATLVISPRVRSLAVTPRSRTQH